MQSRTFAVLFVGVLLSALAAGQANESDPFANAAHLVLEGSGSPIISTGAFVNLMPPILCDESGNSYFQAIAAGPPTTVYRLSLDGATTQFSIPKGTTPNSMLTSFVVDRGGKPSLFMQDFEEKKLVHKIASFSKTGELISTSKMERLLLPGTAVQLDSGDFFVIGSVLPSVRGEKPIRIAAIVDKSGQAVRDLSDQLKNFGMTAAEEMPQAPGVAADARIADDGNIYLFVPGDNLRISVLNQTGAQIRSFSLASPSKDLTPTDYRASAARLLVGYNKKPQKDQKPEWPTYVAYNSQDGTPMAIYTFGEKIKGIVGCMSQEELTFISGTKDGHFATIKASLK